MRVLLGLLIALMVGRSEPATKVLRGNVSCPTGHTVRLMHRYGNVTVKSVAADSLRVEAAVRVDGSDRLEVEGFARDVDLSIAAWADTIFVAILYPGLPEPTSEFSYEVDIDLAMPATVRLDICNSFGDIEVTGIEGGSRLANRFGDIVLRSCRDCEVVSRHGDVQVAEISGSLLVDNGYGNVYLDGVTELVRVDNRYGNVSGRALDGDVVLGNVLGNIDARGGRGRLTLVNRIGAVDAWVDDTGLTDLQVMAELGRVQLNFVRMVPFQLNGRMMGGLIHSCLPVQVSRQGLQSWVAGRFGAGGTRIEVAGAWADFFVGTDSAGGPAPGSTTGVNPGEGR
jgi:hypothetical protein